MLVRLRLNMMKRSRGDSPVPATTGLEPPNSNKLRSLNADAVLRALEQAEAGRLKPAASVEGADPNLVTPKELAHGLTHMLMPACAIAYALALWRIGEDMGWARSFVIRRGLFSHWQVWFGLGVGLQMAIYSLRRRFRNDDDQNQATS